MNVVLLLLLLLLLLTELNRVQGMMSTGADISSMVETGRWSETHCREDRAEGCEIVGEGKVLVYEGVERRYFLGARRPW